MLSWENLGVKSRSSEFWQNAVMWLASQLTYVTALSPPPNFPHGLCVSLKWLLLQSHLLIYKVFTGGNAGDAWRYRFNPWFGKIPWRRKWQPTPLFLPGEFHGQRRLAGYSPWGYKELDMIEHAHTHFQNRSG